jgi:putative hydrolase of the HAD superfamily
MTDKPRNSRLAAHIRARSRPMAPQPTGECPTVLERPPPGAVVFDVYGTLFISGSGDISLAAAEDRSPAIVAALETAGYAIDAPGAPWSRVFLATLERYRGERKAGGVIFPEVRIEEVWRGFIDEARGNAWLHGQGDLELAIVDHECRVNPCWPMPGLAEVLDRLARAAIPMGIVSNAQFYTPLLFPALMGRELADFGLDPGLCVWSYLEREGKPSTRLYRKLAAALHQRGLEPEAVLYLGNDLRNDIRPAAETGFRTALFAGDDRSLRWREDDPDCAGTRPDHIITDLRQLAAAFGATA